MRTGIVRPTLRVGLPFLAALTLLVVVASTILVAVWAKSGHEDNKNPSVFTGQALAADTTEKKNVDLAKDGSPLVDEPSLAPSNDLVTAATYPMVAGTDALEDMSTGTTTLVGASQDDTASALTNIGFDYWFDGVRQTQFSVNPNGLMKLGSPVVNNGANGRTNNFATANDLPKIAAYWDDMCTLAAGKVHSKVVGAPGSRRLVVEWTGTGVFGTSCTDGPAIGTFQVWLYESTAPGTPGAVKFVYGNLGANSVAQGGYSIGIGSSATSFASVTSATDTVSYAASANAQINAITAPKSYLFTPNVPTAPTGLNFTAVTPTSMAVNWTDTAINEVGYAIYRSTDGTNFTFVTQTAANIGTFADSGLLPSTNYFYQVYAVTEGALSSVLAGSQATAPPGNVTCNGAGGNWSATGSWVGGVVPSAGDNVTLGNSCIITVDVTTAAALNVTVQSGATLQFIATPASTLTVGQNVTIDSGGVAQTAGTGTVTTHSLAVGGNLTNNGVIDFSTNADTAGAVITFTGASNNTFGGTGATTDVRAITVNKGTAIANTVELTVSNFSVRGVTTDVAGFLTLTNGTFKISGTFTMANRVFTTATYVTGATTGIWINNPNFTVAGQAGGTTSSIGGLLRLTQGNYNVGVTAADGLSCGTGALIQIEGGVLNATGRLSPQNACTYNQSAGTVNVATVGNSVSNFGSFELFSTTSTFILSGGTINVVNPSTGATKVDVRINSPLANQNITGGNLVIGAAPAPSSTYNVVALLPSTTINAGMTMAVNGAAVFMRGSALVNNGTITAIGASPRLDFGSQNSAMTYSGSGVFGTLVTPFAGVGISANSTFLTTLSAPIICNRVNLFQGGFINSNQFTLGNAGASTTVVQIGSTGLTTAGGSFDVSPNHNQGTGGEIVLYAFETAPRVTGFEINPTRILTSINGIDNINTVTLAGGDLTLSATGAAIVLTNGRFITGANTVILSSGTATVTRTAGYIDGNFRKTFAAAASKGFEVGTANGYSPVTVNATAGTFPATFTVKAVQGAHPSFGTPSLALNRYWTLTEGGDITADLTFNYLDPADIPVTATEANFVIQKYDGSFTQPGGTVAPATNSATITGVTDFSDWTLAEPGALLIPGSFVFSAPTYSTTEEGPTATITVNRTGGSDGAVSVDYATVAGGTASGAAACGVGVDYVNTSGTLNFANTVTTQNFTIPLCGDAVDEPDETVNLALSNPTGGATLGAPNTAVLTLTDDDVSGPLGPVTVTATAGTVGPTDYTTLKAAIDAINAGTHQGAITVVIVTSTVETATSVLNSSGAGPASYTAIDIHPVNDGVTVAGPSVTGRGLIELNGADNVTIDGDNPNTAGINRNLTITNNAANTVTFTSVIRIALATTIVTSADNVTIKNLNLIGNATGRNIPAATTTTGTENTVFGILAAGNASTVSQTTAPAVITSVTGTVGAGATAANLTISNNTVATVARAISVNGAATTVFPGLQISNNTIGNPTAGAVDQVYSQGVTAAGTANGVISGNTIWIEGSIQSSASTHAIDVGVISVNTTGMTVERNVVARVENNDPGTWPAYGINLGGGNNHVVRNNFVRGISTDQVAGTGAFSTTFGSFGIRVGSGTGHKVYHNSVHMTGAIGGTTSTLLTAAFAVVATGQTGCDVRNNIFSNQLTGGNPVQTNTRHVAIFLPSAATVAMNLTLNNNDYFEGTDPNSRMAQVGTTVAVGEFTAANFDPTQTTPAANFRSYTSTLSAAGTNDNASKKVDPLFVSATDLHLTGLSPMVNVGVNVGVTNDIDGETRDVLPDIGADEFGGAPPIPNDVAATAIVTPAPSGSVSTGSTVAPQASFTNVGTATQTNVGVRFTITGPGGFNYLDNAVIPSIASGQTIVVTFATTATITAPGAYVTTALVTTADGNAGNDQVTAGFTAIAPLSGVYNVGTGGDFTSLTNPGGIFDAINGAGATGNLTINITSDLTAETGAVALNQIAGGFTVLLQPSGGAARTISGSAALGLINLNGADGVTINGLNTGGNSLLIRNSGAGATIRMIADASNNTVQNSTVEGASTTAVILIGTGTTTGNDNVAITGNTIRDRTDAAGVPVTLVQSAGSSAAVANSGLNISNNTLINFTANGVLVSAGTENLTVNGNDVSQTANRTTGLFGISVSTSLGTNSISQNTVHGLRSSFAAGTFVNTAGIFLLDVRDGTVSRNRLYDFPAVAGGTGRIVGIEFEGATGTTSTVTVANNMVSIVTSVATAQSVFGIFDFAFPTNTFNGFYNTVYIGGTASGASNSWAINRGFDPTFHTLRNNIAFNNRTGGTGSHFAAGDQSAGSGTYSSNFNFFAGTGATAANFMDRDTSLTGTSTPVSFPVWQAGPPARDANSVAGIASTFNPALFFVNANGGDLHLLATATQVLDAGTPLGTVTTDYDNDPRSATTPDIGADELVAGPAAGSLQFSAPTYTVGEAGPQATITVTRTGGSSGIVGASYATVAGGTATGGAACGGAVDYVNTSGTVSFGDGVTTPQTFDVPICDDSADEVDETVNLALTLPTGGATLGAQNTAVLTITDNDAAPSISINDVTMAEGNAGTTMFTFTVSLSTASGQTVSVHYQTADGTATLADNDYQQVLDTTLTFNPGQTSLPVTVLVNGDTNAEPNETFFVNLSTPTNATISDNQGQGNITNDDAVLPGLSIGDARVTEGNNGDRNMTFTVTYQGGGAASVHYHTTNGTAQADVLPPAPGAELVPHGSDYVPEQNGIISFGTNPDPEGGAQTRTFNIIIHGDTFKEPNEYFTVTLDQPIGGTITRGTGFGVIVDEDRAYIGDLDNDKKTDFTVFRPSDANWYTIQSSNNNPVYLAFGVPTDKPVPGDYDGDGKQDYAVRRPGGSNQWWYQFSSDFSLHNAVFGIDSDLSVQADYDGDDKTDVAVFRDGTWYILQSSDQQQRTVFFGQAGDVPVPGDFDGDGKADLTVFRNGTWYMLRSSDNTSTAQVWGQSGDKPVAGDFDGDGRFDLAVFRSGTWHILNSLLGTYTAVNFGLASDLTVPGDYDGDGTTDIAVFRPSGGDWYAIRSSNNTLLSFHWGLNGDIPIPSAYQP